MTKNKIIGAVMLIICTVIWGCAFSFQTIASSYVAPFTLIGLRFIIAGVVLTPLLIIHIKKNKVVINYKVDLLGGVVIGVFLGVASIVQQFGIENTTTGKAGFLTAMYIIFVPIISYFLFKKKTNIIQILAIILTVFGVGLLSLNEEFRINIGDILCLICGLLFAFQIISVDYFNRKSDSIFLAVVSFYTCGILSAIFGLIFEGFNGSGIIKAIWPILYLGVCSSGIAYSLQILGQKRISGVPAALIMSLEAIFSLFFAWVLLNETMSRKELIGALLMMIGVVVVQIFDGKIIKKKTINK